MEKMEKIRNLIIKEMCEEYKKSASYLGKDPEELIKENLPGLEQFASSLAAKINIIIEN